MKGGIRIAVVEDDAVYRRALVTLLAARPGWEVVAVCTSAEEAVREVPEARPSLALVDVVLPRRSGIELVAQLKERLPALPVVLLTVVEDADQITRAIRLGACGYLLKRERENLIEGIENVLSGGAPLMSPSVARSLWRLEQNKGPHPALEQCRLTPREREVLRLAARGRQKGEIAGDLDIAVNTVRNHFRHIYEKLGAHSVIEAVMKVRANSGLLED